MQIECPSCRQTILSEDMNLHYMAAKCRQCHAFLDLRQILNQRAEAAPPKPRPAVGTPPRFRVDVDENSLAISRRWLGVELLVLAPFCLFWDSILAVFLAAGPFPGLFILPHTLVGVGMTYYALSLALNRTTIRVDHDAVSIRHGPLPWVGNQTLPTDAVQQLYVDEHLKPFSRGIVKRYGVLALTRDGQARSLVNFDTAHEALFVEQRVEAFLGIPDKPVRGEIARDDS